MRKMLNTLYVMTPESYLTKDGEDIVISVKQQETFRIPIINIEQIVMFGYMGASPGAMKLCADHGVSLTFQGIRGRKYKPQSEQALHQREDTQLPKHCFPVYQRLWHDR